MRRPIIAAVASAIVFVACAKGNEDLPPEDDAGLPPGMDSAACTTMCNGVCADLKTDVANCGKCGTACPMGATCVQGSCQCASGQTNCNKVCVDTKTDVANCGKCGTVCGGGDGGVILGGGTWACTNGACSIVCPMGKTECGGACVDTKTDNEHCGMCDNACAMNEQCTEGQCCKTGEKVCGGMCTDVQNDANNCGMCGNKCSGNTPACAGGMCIACGNDCWSSAGCLTAGGHCIKFSCRAGNAGANFCNNCQGWKEVSYQDWMANNGAWCKDVISKYRQVEGTATKCGSAANCCGSSQQCSGGDNAWHFYDGANNRYTGPCLGCANDSNCTYWNGTDNGNYTRLTVCQKF